jgi:regulator of cell morphogenesis and NO signaling
MKNIKEMTVGQMVSENIKTAHVFKKYNIDFCCGGGISIAKACEKTGVSLDKLESDLMNIEEHGRMYDYKSWNLSFLISHIVQVHHRYVLDTLPILESYAEKVAKVHGLNYPEVVTIYKEVLHLQNELISHLNKEEKVLFPLISKMLTAKSKGLSIEKTNIEGPILQMFSEHDHAGDVFKKISKITDNYTPPTGACQTFKALYNLLEEFENDLHLHIHLENNILFPKAKELHESFNA